MEQPSASGPRWDAGIGAFVEDADVQFSPDPDRTPPPSGPAPSAAPAASPAAPAARQPIDGMALLPALEGEASRFEAVAQQHEQRLGVLFREGQADVANVEDAYREGRAEGVRDVAALGVRQMERQVAARQLAAEILRNRQERDKNNLWSAALELGIIPTAPSTPTPAASTQPVSVAGAPTVGDEFTDLSDEDRNLMGLPVNADEPGPTQLDIETARVIGLA